MPQGYFENLMKQPNKVNMQTTDIFDAPGYVQKVDFANERATYSAVKLKPPWKPITAFGGPILPFHNSVLYNAGNTNVMQFDGKYIALYDSGTPYIIGKHGDVEPLVALNGSINAHPKVLADGSTAFMKLTHSFDICSTSKTKVRTTIEFITVAKHKHGDKVVSRQTIDYPRFLYVHDFIVTESYYILFDHNVDIDISFGRWDGVAKRLHADDKQHMLLIHRNTSISTSTSAIQRVALPSCMDGRFTSHHVFSSEDSDKQLRVASIVYTEYMQGPMNIYAFDICRGGERDAWEVRNVHIVPGACEFPVNLATASTTALSCFSHIGYFQWSMYGKPPTLVEVYREPHTLFTEVAWDPISKHALCYVYRNNRIWLQIYSVPTNPNQHGIYNNWHLVCEFGFHNITGVCSPAPGLHGTFYSKHNR